MIAFSTQRFDAVDASAVSSWAALVDEHRLNPSLAPGWLRIAHGALGEAGSPITVFVGVNSGGGLAAVVPFYFSDVTMLGIPMRQLELGSNLSSYHAELVAPGYCLD